MPSFLFAQPDCVTVQQTATTLHQLFIDQAGRTPDQIAVQFEASTLTYDELHRKSDQLAQQLQQCGVGPESVVGIVCYRSLEMIVGLLAVLKAGGAYVPLDPDYPENRLAFLIADSKPTAILCQKRLRGKIKAPDARVICLEQAGTAGPAPLVSAAQPNNLAYLIYTSGSTGVPKGVMIEHQSIVNTIAWRKAYYCMSSVDVVLQLPSISFDSSVADIFTALASGAKLLLINQSQRLNVKYMQKLIADESVTHFLTVPSFYKALLNENSHLLEHMRFVTIAGEDFTPHLVDEHFRKLPQVQLYNEYGPTENSVCSTCYQFQQHDGNGITIGKPITYTEALVLDTDGNQVGEGELYLSGAGLARGYLRNAELTGEKFIAHPFQPGARLYRTGDWVRRLPDGNYKYLGRMDHQIKIRGFRVELKEIEYHMLKSGLVKDAFVTMRVNAEGNKALVAYAVADAAQGGALLAALQANLPEYSIPYHFIYVNELPLTPNGKIDIQSLPTPETRFLADSSADSFSQKTKLENIIGSMTGRAVRLDPASLHQDLIKLGVDSLAYIKLLVQIENEFGFEFDYGDLMSSANVTAGDLLSIIERNAAQK
ncbi:non-ribosomal peptide synthetase [Paenibacillus athensensis]|nr:non-ribosomal peptide synthetase [Paenibacillus athensensis]MCD1258893.1 non-ribosomal peptide synthetase [Paenibacillus athensensis]